MSISDEEWNKLTPEEKERRVKAELRAYAASEDLQKSTYGKLMLCLLDSGFDQTMQSGMKDKERLPIVVAAFCDVIAHYASFLSKGNGHNLRLISIAINLTMSAKLIELNGGK